ncbi:MAG: hypothetical protein HOW73_22300 [Polyangiaceae bacterium]|nr:hypothetical protein [Polyangiaceae bacterium]
MGWRYNGGVGGDPTYKSRLWLVIAFVGVVAGCVRTAEVASQSDGALLLDACQQQRESPEVTAWYCGDLTAIEAVVLSATDREVALAFDEFAANFAGKSVKRVDSEYAKGEARHKTMRLEGQGRAGESLEGEMVAVSIGNGVRLVTCSNRTDPAKPRGHTVPATPSCGAVVSHLVYGGAGARVSKVDLPAEN